MVGFLKTLIGWASGAWAALFGAGSNPVDALTKLWHFIGSVHDLFTWLAGGPALALFGQLVRLLQVIDHAYADVVAMGRRIRGWILAHDILPWVRFLAAIISRNAMREQADVAALYREDAKDLLLAAAYTERLFALEHRDMLAEVAAARAYALQLDKALHQAIEAEAASGYATDLHDRLGTIATLLDDIAAHNPVVKGLVGDLVKAVLDLIGVENPLARIALGVVLKEIIGRLGVDKIAGHLAADLIDSVTAENHPKTLHDVIAALARRTSKLEDQWAEFMKHGGADVEAAGDDWKAITGVIADGAILATFALSVADPQAWATGVSDTLGVVTAESIRAVTDLIHRA